MKTAIVTGRSAEHSRLRLLMEQSQTNVECTSYYDARSFIKAAKREELTLLFKEEIVLTDEHAREPEKANK